MNQSLSEHAAKPRAVIVHDPTRWDALSAFDGAAAPAPERLLFQGVPDPQAYRRDMARFLAALEGLVDRVIHLDQLVDVDARAALFAANPNHVFTRDSAITLPWAPGHFIPCNMARPLRRDEPAVMAEALGALGLSPLLDLPPELHLEGGDVIPFAGDGKRCLFIGHGPRSDLATAEYLAARLIPEWLDEIVAIRLSPRRINLDGAFCPLDGGLVVANFESLLEARRLDRTGGRSVALPRLLEETGLAPIEVAFDDSRARQACNGFCAGDRRVALYDLCPPVLEAVEAAGLSVTRVPGAELVKGNGGPRCMTRPVYG